MIDRIITAYKAKKLMLQAQEVQQTGVQEEREMLYDDLKKRMDNAYKRNKRDKKIEKLQADPKHWSGLK